MDSTKPVKARTARGHSPSKTQPSSPDEAKSPSKKAPSPEKERSGATGSDGKAKKASAMLASASMVSPGATLSLFPPGVSGNPVADVAKGVGDLVQLTSEKISDAGRGLNLNGGAGPNETADAGDEGSSGAVKDGSEMNAAPSRSKELWGFKPNRIANGNPKDKRSQIPQGYFVKYRTRLTEETMRLSNSEAVRKFKHGGRSFIDGFESIYSVDQLLKEKELTPNEFMKQLQEYTLKSPAVSLDDFVLKENPIESIVEEVNVLRRVQMHELDEIDPGAKAGSRGVAVELNNGGGFLLMTEKRYLDDLANNLVSPDAALHSIVFAPVQGDSERLKVLPFEGGASSLRGKVRQP